MRNLIVTALMLLVTFVVLASPQGVPVYTKATVGTTVSQILATNLNRGYLIIQNATTNNCVVSPVSFVSPNGLVVLAGQNYETDEAFTKTTWFAACSAANTSLNILETNY